MKCKLPMMDKLKPILPHLAAIVIFVITCGIYFSPQFEGKILRQGDIISYKGMAQEAIAYKQETGETALWTNSMFGGMPTYQISSPQKNNLVKRISKVFRLFFARPMGIFLSGMITFYICLLLLGASPSVSIIMSLGFGLGTVNMINFEAGHVTKVSVIMSLAPMLAGLVLTMRKKYLLGGAIFTFFFALGLSNNHVQMIYYAGLFCAIYMILKLVEAIQAKSLADYGKSTLVLLVGGLLAFGTFSSKFLISKEFAKDTMRGKPILEKTGATAQSSSETDGLEWEYAMQYSHNYKDVLGAIVPRAAGGSSAEWVSKDSKFAKLIKSRKPTQAPLYFGGLPPTAGVFYLGAVLFLLFLIGVVMVRGSLKWWLVATFIFSILLSMGKYASWINWPLFKYLPFFNNFRAPNSVMAVTALFVPVLSGLGLQQVLIHSDKEDALKKLKYVLTGFGGFLLLFALIGPSVMSLDGPTDGNYTQYPGLIDALKEDRTNMLRSSAFRSLIFVLLAGGSLFAYLRGWLKNKLILIGIIGALIVADLGVVSSRYLSKDDFVSKRSYDKNFTPRNVDTQILQDKDPHYRVHDVTTNPWASSAASYHHKTVGGYNAAKLQRIQDVIDRYLISGKQSILNMLNTKYIIQPGSGGEPIAQRNPAAMGNAWYVSAIKYVNTPNEEIDALEDLDPHITAVVHDEFKSQLNNMIPSIDGTIKLTNYSPNKVTYSANGNGEHLAVFSEAWYGPDKGWKAYIDGKEVSHLRANYFLRALRIPGGSHEVVFEFNPSLYRTGEMISLISSLLIFLLCGYSLFIYFKSKKSLSHGK